MPGGYFGAHYTVKIDASDAIEDLSEIHRRMEVGYVGPLTRGAMILGLEFAKNFFSAGSSVGGWAPLDEETVRWKAGRGFPPAPLIRTGRLAAQVTSMMGPANRILPREAVLAPNLGYGKFHQMGTKHMPARKIVFIPVGFAGEMTGMINRYVMGRSFGGVV